MKIKRKGDLFKVSNKYGPLADGYVSREEAVKALFLDRLRSFKLDMVREMNAFPHGHRDEDDDCNISMVRSEEGLARAKAATDRVFEGAKDDETYFAQLDREFARNLKEYGISLEDIAGASE